MILGKKRTCTLLTIVLLTLISICLVFVCKNNLDSEAQAETVEFVGGTTYDKSEVRAEYLFTRLSGSECSVRIANKAVATIAIIPSETVIDGVKYTVSEITTNGFASSPMLKKVWLPSSITKIGIMAFLKCDKLEKVTLGNVKSIGNNAFMSCPNLTELIIPKSVEIIGTTILRNNNTLVRVRSESAGLNWVSTWNNGNANQDVEYKSNFTAMIEYEPVYASQMRNGRNALADNEIIGYTVAEGQDFVDYYYQDNDIIVPSKHPDTGKDIISLDAYCFSGCSFNRLLIEYSKMPIYIVEGTFMDTIGKSIIINRPVYFKDGSYDALNVFAFSMVENIIMPNSIDIIAPYMFYDAANLKSIRFIGLKDDTISEQLKLAESFVSVVQLPNFKNLKIMEGAFSGTINIEQIYIPHNVSCVQANVFDGWTSTQKIVIDFRQKSLPDYNSELETGWINDFLSNCAATIQYLRFNISFESNINNYLIPDQEAIIDRPLGVLPIPQKENATFLGWFTEDKGKGDKITEEKVYYVANDIIIYADWSYNINFDSNGGCDIESLNIREGDEIVLPATIKGDAIGRWKDVDSGKVYDFNEEFIMPDHSINLIAEWLYNLSFDSNGGTCSTKISKLFESTVTYLPEATREGYKGYWVDTKNNVRYEFNSRYTVKNHANFRAIWSEKTFNELKNYKNEYEIYTANQIEYIDDYRLNNYTFSIMKDINISRKWNGIEDFIGIIKGNNHTITYYNYDIAYGQTYGFIINNRGNLYDIKFQPNLNINGKKSDKDDTIQFGVGGAVGINRGLLNNVRIEKSIDNPYMTTSGEYNIDIYAHDVFSLRLGGIAGENYGNIDSCVNNASLGGSAQIGGIVGLNYENARLINCFNYGNIYFNHAGYGSICIAGLVSTVRDKGYVAGCGNYAEIIWAAKLHASSLSNPAMARLVAQVCSSVVAENNYAGGSVKVVNEVWVKLSDQQRVNIKDQAYAITFNPPGTSSGGGSCVAAGTLVTLANGEQVPVETLNGNEQLLVWNFSTGKFDIAPILFIDNDSIAEYEVINLYFSDGTIVKIIDEHAFWDFNLNRFVFLRRDAAQYIGHNFNKQHIKENGSMVWTSVELLEVHITSEITSAWSPVTREHICYYVNGMLSMPGATEGFANIFKVDNETMKYNEIAFAMDVEKYGLFTYEEFISIIPITEDVFVAFNGQYLKVAIGKGLINIDSIKDLIQRYAEFL